MENTRLHNVYAKAAFDLSQEMNITNEVLADINLMIQVCNQNRDFIQMLRNPVIKPFRKQQIVTEIFKHKITPLTLTFFNHIISKRREKYLPRIAESFVKHYNKISKIKLFQLESANPINNATREQLINLLQSQTQHSIQLIEQVNKALIGGFKLTTGDIQYDASIQKRLQQIKQQLLDF